MKISRKGSRAKLFSRVKVGDVNFVVLVLSPLLYGHINAWNNVRRQP